MATTYDEVVAGSPKPPAVEPGGSPRTSRDEPALERSPLLDFGWLALTGGLLVAAIGIVQLAAWHLQWSALLFLQANTPMAYNTTLALTVSGAAIASAVRGPGRWLRVAGIVDVILGGITIVKYVFGWSLGVDELFGLAHFAGPTGHFGLMSVNTAGCFVVIGAAFLVWRPGARRWRSVVLIAVGPLVASISIVALFGYLAGPHAFDWLLRPMSLISAICLTILAMSLTALAFATRTQRDSQILEWLAVPVGVTTFVITILMWFLFEEMGRSTRVSAYEVSRAVLLLSLVSCGTLVLMMWLSHNAINRRRRAESLTEQLREEVALREQAEIAARDSARLRVQFLEALPVGVYISHADGRPDYANRVATTMLGDSIHPDMTNDKLPDAYQTSADGSCQVYPRDQLPLLRACAGESSHVDDLELHLPDGVVPLEMWGKPLTDDSGQVEFGLAVFVDISERRRTEKVLAQHAALLDIAHDVIYVRDADGHITFWNQGAEVIYGWTREEAVGQVVHTLLRTEFPMPFDAIQAILCRDGHWDGELVQHSKSGERTVVASRFVAELNPDGTIATVMAINTDITARKRAEAELVRIAVEREELNEELRRSNDELEQFAYVASHDLSEPLRAISGPVSLLARRYQGQLDADADRFIGFAVDGCERMQTLINDLLAVSRLGRAEMRISSVDTNALVGTVLDVLAPAIEARRAQVTSDDLPEISGDASQLNQLFQNLISNAIKFTPPDVEPRIHLGCRQERDHLRFTVTDNGIGIDERHRERIFGMFKRLHTREAYPGTGIGLAVCKKIVERHRGTLGVADGPDGHGTTFWFTIPSPQEARHDTHLGDRTPQLESGTSGPDPAGRGQPFRRRHDDRRDA